MGGAELVGLDSPVCCVRAGRAVPAKEACPVPELVCAARAGPALQALVELASSARVEWVVLGEPAEPAAVAQVAPVWNVLVERASLQVEPAWPVRMAAFYRVRLSGSEPAVQVGVCPCPFAPAWWKVLAQVWRLRVTFSFPVGFDGVPRVAPTVARLPE